MLTNKAIHDEINKVDDYLATQDESADTLSLKLMTLILKMLFSIRTNQVLTMEKLGVDKLRTNKKAVNE